MTVTTTTSSIVYVGNGSTTEFAFPFKVIDEEHLRVTKRDAATDVTVLVLTLGVHYTVDGIGEDAGTVTLTGSAFTSDFEIVIERVVPFTQELDIVNSGGFYPETVEDQLDLIVMQIQQLNDGDGRAVTVPVGGDDIQINPEGLEEGDLLQYSNGQIRRLVPDPFAGKFYAGDANGHVTPSSGTGADAGLRADLAADARPLLGYPILAGEVGVVDLTWPWGWLPRYGPVPGPIVWEAIGDYLTNFLRTGLAGFPLVVPVVDGNGFYNTSWNWTNLYGVDGVSITFQEGVVFAGLLHFISSATPANKIAPTAITAANPCVVTKAGHGLPIGEARLVTFRNTGMAALDGQEVIATPTSSSSITITANTTGQVWSATGDFSDVHFRDVKLHGTVASYDRIGSYMSTGWYVERMHAVDDPTKHITGLHNRGVHIYFNTKRAYIGQIVSDYCGPQSEGVTNHAAVAIDGPTAEPECVIQDIYIVDSATNGLILNGKFSVGSFRCNAYGASVPLAITTPPATVAPALSAMPAALSGQDALSRYPNEIFAAVILSRFAGRIGYCEIDQTNGYATGRAYAAYGIIVEGYFNDGADLPAAKAFTKSGAHINHLVVGDVKGQAVSVGNFGQAGSLTIGRFDAAPMQTGNDMYVDAGHRLAFGFLNCEHGHLGWDHIEFTELEYVTGVQINSNSDATYKQGTIIGHSHRARLAYIRGRGAGAGAIMSHTRQGGALTIPTVEVSGTESKGANIGPVILRKTSTPIAAPGLLFAPARGSVGNIDIIGYAPTTANVYACQFGNGNGNRIMATQGGYVDSGYDTGSKAGNGVGYDGTQDSVTIGLRVERFALGVDEGATANSRLNCQSCIAGDNSVDTALPDANLAVGALAAPMGNLGWSV